MTDTFVLDALPWSVCVPVMYTGLVRSTTTAGCCSGSTFMPVHRGCVTPSLTIWTVAVASTFVVRLASMMDEIFCTTFVVVTETNVIADDETVEKNVRSWPLVSESMFTLNPR